jgi:hypothetical protein
VESDYAKEPIWKQAVLHAFAIRGRGSNVIQRPETIGELLAGRSPRLGELKARAEAFAGLAERVRALLPASEAAHVTGIVQCDTGIVLLVDSSVWCARLRYRAGALRSAFATLTGHEIRELRVRVVPRGGQAGRTANR